MQKTVLLTGAAGFIGSHFAESYLKAGWRVVGVDNFSFGKRENLRGCEGNAAFILCEGDICDRVFVEGLFARYKPHTVNHQAAQKSVPASVEDPHFDAQVNILGLLNLLMACKENPIVHFLFASTGGAMAAEPVGDVLPTEEDKPQLISPYAITKFASENYIAAYAELFGFAHTSLRYANVYGPRQVPAGECGVIPIFVENAQSGQPSTLFAYEDMPEGCTRDYVHVYDVVAAGMLASEKPTNEPLFISTSVELPIARIYQALMDALGLDLPLHRAGPRAGDVRRSVISNARAKEILGWEPKISLREGLAMLAK